MQLPEFILLRKATIDDATALEAYYKDLNDVTKKRFAPHSFEENELKKLLKQEDRYLIHIAIDERTEKVIAYIIGMHGTFDYDKERWKKHNIELDDFECITFAPSVSEAWQGKGIGQSLFIFCENEFKQRKIKRIILWGGVQCSNVKAVNFYLRNGFQLVGYFDYQGANYDMLKKI